MVCRIYSIGAAYALGMTLTTIHELGHALCGKLFWGDPIDITLGATPYSGNRPILQLGGIKLGGFNPATAYARIPSDSNGSRNKQIMMLLAGPVFGAVSSGLALTLLCKKYPGQLYLTKAAACFGLFNHTLGVAGIGGINLPGSDGNRIYNLLKQR